MYLCPFLKWCRGGMRYTNVEVMQTFFLFWPVSMAELHERKMGFNENISKYINSWVKYLVFLFICTSGSSWLVLVCCRYKPSTTVWRMMGWHTAAPIALTQIKGKTAKKYCQKVIFSLAIFIERKEIKLMYFRSLGRWGSISDIVLLCRLAGLWAMPPIPSISFFRCWVWCGIGPVWLLHRRSRLLVGIPIDIAFG